MNPDKIMAFLNAGESLTRSSGESLDRAFNIDRWISDHNIPTTGSDVVKNGTRLIGVECPNDANHKDAAIIVQSDGKLGFHCFHQSCSAFTWRDYRRVYEPESHAGDFDGGENEGEWPELLPLTSYSLPGFPVEALPEWVAIFAADLAETTQTPVDLAALMALTALSAAVAKKAVISPRMGWSEPLNLYTVAALPPANRKSAVFSEVMRPMLEFEEELQKEKAAEVRASAVEYKALEQALQQAQTERAKALKAGDVGEDDHIAKLCEQIEAQKLPTLPQLVADDATPEAVAGLLASQGGRLAILSAEGELFEIMGGRYSNGVPNLGIFLKAHAGDDWRGNRVGRGVEEARAPALTIGLAVQPEVLKSLTRKPGFRGKGLLARFLYSLPKSSVGHRKVGTKPLSDMARNTYAYSLTELLRINVPEKAHVITLNSDAESCLLSYEADIEAKLGEFGELASVADWAGKLCGAVVRIAGILFLGDRATSRDLFSQQVDADTMRRAIKIGCYLIEHAKATFDLMGSDPEMEAAKRFLRWIEKNGQSVFSRKDLFEAVKGSFPQVAMLEPGISILVERGFIRKKLFINEVDEEGRKKAGRKRTEFEVNPALFSSNFANNKNNANDAGVEDFDAAEGGF